MKTKVNVLFSQDSRRPLEGYSRKDIVERGPGGVTIGIYGDSQQWVAYRSEYRASLNGDKKFWKRISNQRCGFYNKKLSGDIHWFIEYLVETLSLDWIKNNPWTTRILMERKDLWTQVFKGKITNPEMLCKYFSKKYFRGAFSYRALKSAYESQHLPVSLWDLWHYTTNPEISLQMCVEIYKDSYDCTFADCLRCAKILDEKINPKWSSRRLHEEHQKQLEKINLQELERISDTPLIEGLPKFGDLELIVDERTCCIEGMSMHNCIHSCYWTRVELGNYLIARGTINGEYINLGMDVYNTVGNPGSALKVNFNQVHTIYNGRPVELTVQLAKEWIDTFEPTLVSIAAKIKQNTLKPIKQLCRERDYVDMPF